MYNNLKNNDKDGDVMSLFTESNNRRNKIVNKYVKKVVKVMKYEIKKTVRKGGLSTELRIDNIGIYNLPEGMTDEIYERSKNELNNYYNGEVKVEIGLTGYEMKYKILNATIVKV